MYYVTPQYILRPGSGQPFGSILNASDYFWLPSDSPFGNLQLKLFSVGGRLGHANHRLSECYVHWREAHSDDPVQQGLNLASYGFVSEEAIHAMRRSADELLALIWYLESHIKTGEYSESLEVDCVGAALKKRENQGRKQGDSKGISLVDRHKDMLDRLNRLANSYKHSFMQSDLTIVGAMEPCVALLHRDRNKLSNALDFENISLTALVSEFNGFVADSFNLLRELSNDISDGASGVS